MGQLVCNQTYLAAIYSQDLFIRSVPREPTGLELVQPTENQGVSSPEDASVHHMVVVARTHHEDQGMVFPIITSDIFD